MPKPTVVATAEVLAQGAVLEVSTDGGTIYNTLPGLDEIPRIGDEGSFVEVTNINEIIKRFVKGIRTPPEWELVCKRIGNSTVQDAIIAKAQDNDDEVPVDVKITYRSGDILDAQVVLNGFFMDTVQQGDNNQMFAIKGQQTGSIVMTKVV